MCVVASMTSSPYAKDFVVVGLASTCLPSLRSDWAYSPLTKGNREETLIETRRAFFSRFLKAVLALPHLARSPLLHDFLQSPSPSPSEQTFSPTQLLLAYKEAFTLPPPHEEDTKRIDMFQTFLNKASNVLRLVRQLVQNLCEERRITSSQLTACFGSLLQDYDNAIFRRYSCGLPLYAGTPILALPPNPFEEWRLAVHYETLEIEAIRQAFADRTALYTELNSREEKILLQQAEVAKLRSGKTTFKSFFGMSSRAEQITTIERSLPAQQRQIDHLRQLLVAINSLLSRVVLPRFLADKAANYHSYMARFATEEVKYFSKYGDYMRGLIDALREQQQ